MSDLALCPQVASCGSCGGTGVVWSECCYPMPLSKIECACGNGGGYIDDVCPFCEDLCEIDDDDHCSHCADEGECRRHAGVYLTSGSAMIWLCNQHAIEELTDHNHAALAPLSRGGAI